jgi:hypothetical protein
LPSCSSSSTSATAWSARKDISDITFGTLVAAGLPLLIGLTSVMAALGLVAVASHLFPADANLPAVVLLIALAVGGVAGEARLALGPA